MLFRSRIVNPLGMHSAGAEAARALPQDKGTVEQILGMLRGKVPEAELEHAGLEEALKGKTSVSKEDVAKHFESQLPQIQETTFGGKDSILNEPQPGVPFTPEFDAHHERMRTYRDDYAEDMYNAPYNALDD